jgi:hypothetical protein
MMGPGSKKRPRPPLVAAGPKIRAEIFLLDQDSNGQALTAPMSRLCCTEPPWLIGSR